MFRGWEVHYVDGTVIKEGEVDWKEIKKANIVKLILFYDGRFWSLSGKEGYLQKKQASVIPGVPGSFQVESRSIGYYDGPTKVWYTVNESTGVMKMTVEEA